MKYAIYLRKSRADAEAEQRGEGETLARHEYILLELAKKHHLSIIQIYREIVSGDSISARPQMQKLLQDITDNKYDGVLVVEIERLARGDTIDQGIVAQAFKSSNTKIITPTKTYDPNNEFDEEYFEFSLFMSRREYKTIKRRMQTGRIASVKEGNYIYTNAPYGYRKTHPKPKIHTLEIIESEAKIVKKIYNMYLSGKGARAIATELNRLQIPPQKSLLWEKVSIRKILTNPIYAGKIQWQDNKNGVIICDGLHKAIISPEQWQKVQDNMKNCPLANIKPNTEMVNYYHNILFCSNCGHQMKYRPTNEGYMLCRYNQCRGKVVASSIKTVDNILLSSVSLKIKELKEQLQNNKTQQNSNKQDTKLDNINTTKSAIQKLNKQIDKLHTLLETDVYTVETYLERSKILNAQKQEFEKQLKELEQAIEPTKISLENELFYLEDIISNFEKSNAKKRNEMLIRAIQRISYYKTTRMCKNKTENDIKLDISFF